MKKPSERMLFKGGTYAVVGRQTIPRTHVTVNCYCLGVSEVHIFHDNKYGLTAVTSETEVFLEDVDGLLNPHTVDLRVPKLLLITAYFAEIVKQRYYRRTLCRHLDLWVGF
jgi:hypothetical protein